MSEQENLSAAAQREDHTKTGENRDRIIGMENREEALIREIGRIRDLQEEDHKAIADIHLTITSNKGFWAGILLATGAFWGLIMALVMLIKEKVF